MRKFERFIVYPLILIQLIVLSWCFFVFKDNLEIVDGNIKRIVADEFVSINEEEAIVAMLGNVNENGHVSVRDRYGKLITLAGVIDEGDDLFKARIVIADHYEEYSIGEIYGIGGLKEVERYDYE
ncbi:MAG: hypothetical protein ACOCRK_04290 [bacterium]